MTVLSIDIGTSRTKAALYSEALDRAHLRSCPTRAVLADGTVDTAALVNDAIEAGAAVMEDAASGGVDAVVVSAIMGHALIAGSGSVFSARAWNDRRCAAEAARLAAAFARSGGEPGRPVGPELLAPHLLWLARHQPDTLAAVDRAIGLKDLVVREFVGGAPGATPSTDLSHRDYALLLDPAGAIHGAVLDELGKAGARAAVLAPIAEGLSKARAAHTVAGALAGPAADRLGIAAGTPVVLGSSDGTAAMYGAGVLAGDAITVVSGTTDVAMASVDAMPENDPAVERPAAPPVPSPAEEGLSLNAAMTADTFLVGGSTGSSGASLSWWRGNFSGPGRSGDEWRAVPPGARGVLVAPGFGGERAPFYRGHRGVVSGLTLRHGPAEVERAIIEANAYRRAVLVERVAGVAPTASGRLLAGGGAQDPAIEAIHAALFPGEYARLEDDQLTLAGSAMFAIAALDGGTTKERDVTLVALARTVRGRTAPVPVEASLREEYGRLFAWWRERVDAMFDVADESAYAGIDGGQL